MNKEDRLLTPRRMDELFTIELDNKKGIRWLVCKAVEEQDTKSYTQTLKDVGEKLLKMARSADGFPEFHAEAVVFAIALKQGKRG